MSGWRPLSKRGKADARLDEPTEGLPGYLAGPVIEWVRDCFTDPDAYPVTVRVAALQRLQLRFKLDQPLKWRDPQTAGASLLERIVGNEEFGLDVLDYMLHHIQEFTPRFTASDDIATRLNTVLHNGGSAWEVVKTRDAFQLSRRAVGPIREAIEAIPPATRAHQHLVAAWNRLSGRNPDESGAYREAVRAVEAAAKPIILPSDPNATLGKMIAAMRDRPDKWSTTIGSVDDVRQLMASVWTSQLDRHGTDDESVPLNVSADQADAAVHICLTLVRLFVGGHVQRVNH
jgi:hypothetical protein